MQLLISDANILIDLEEGKLIEKMFCLSFKFKIPDLLFFDELEVSHAHLQEMGLQLGELTPESIEYSIKLQQKYSKPSRYDCFALALAKQESCPLLTGDKALRKAAQEQCIETKGTIWLIEQMIEQRLISISEARQAFQLMKNAGSRLPWNDAEKLLQQLEKTIK